ncbi:MAG: hypothetical protein ACI97A_001872 [Planctomycetota bacterium]
MSGSCRKAEFWQPETQQRTVGLPPYIVCDGNQSVGQLTGAKRGDYTWFGTVPDRRRRCRRDASSPRLQVHASFAINPSGNSRGLSEGDRPGSVQSVRMSLLFVVDEAEEIGVLPCGFLPGELAGVFDLGLLGGIAWDACACFADGTKQIVGGMTVVEVRE